MPDTHIIQRAFQLARLGDCANVNDIRAALAREGYESVPQHLAGPELIRQLRGIIAATRVPEA